MELDGTWDLEVSTPFGTYPAKMFVEAGGAGGRGGRIESRLGTALLSDVAQTPDGLEGVVALELKGHTYTARVTARVEGARIEGQIRVNNIPFAPPARFTGTKAI